MPWRKTDVSQERIKFVVLASRKERTMEELCQEFGISRQTGYTWLKRFEEQGVAGIVEESRRPQNSPRKIGRAVEEALLAGRKERPDWGARKLRHCLQQDHPELGQVGLSTVHRILLRNQAVADQDRHRAAVKRFERGAPNELWQMDFKGPKGFDLDIGPLSILDDHSRYLVALRHVGSTQLEPTQQAVEATFEENGVPEGMLMDHGTPWWNGNGAWGWTELTVWLLRLGVRIAWSGVRHPQTQGKVERMHGALQSAVCKRGGQLDQQAWLDRFRQEYNQVRPHEALGMATPASRWKPSERLYQRHPKEWEYPAGLEVIRLASQGQMHWRGKRWDLGRPFRNQTVGLETLDTRVLVYYCRSVVRELDLKTGKSLRVALDRLEV